MSDERVSIESQQKRILQVLVTANKITTSQAESHPISESLESIIPDIVRMSGNEDAVVAAAAETLSRPVYVEVEEGRSALLPEGEQSFCVYDGHVFVCNPLDQRLIRRALSWARQKKDEGVLKHNGEFKLGVITSTRLDALNNHESSDQGSASDSNEVAKVRAKKLIHDVLRSALSKGSSDIHFQPSLGDKIQVRFRIDGSLRTHRTYPFSFHDSICRVAIESLCGLTLETGKPQDGKFEFEYSSNRVVPMRMSSMPALRGTEKTLKIALRVLDQENSLAKLDDLSLSPHNLAAIRRIANMPDGMFAITGPVGSGKTTTLNASLYDAYRNNPDRNFHTIEQPVEIQHEGMTHTECGPQLEFVDALRSMVRQDPDVIFLGEMRDQITAEVAYGLAQTGRLLLSSFHSNNAHQGINRLVRMGIPLDIVVDNTCAFGAQRLVRRLCPFCKIEYRLKGTEYESMYGSNKVFQGHTDITLFKADPRGCSKCGSQSRGMRGRVGILEILEFTPEIQDALLNGMSPTVLRRQSISDGLFEDMWDDGFRLVKEGVICFSELEAKLRPYATDRLFRGKTITGALPSNIRHPQSSNTRLLPQL